MKKLSRKARRNLEDSLWSETKTEIMVKRELMQKYRFPARIARKVTEQLLKDAIQYWAYEDIY